MSTRNTKSWFGATGLLAILALPVLLAGQARGQAPTTEIQLFQTGQASWEWLLVPANHAGASGIRAGQSCHSCHTGEESLIGTSVVSSAALEPQRLADMPAFIDLSVEGSIRDNQLQLRLTWPELSGGSAAGEGDYPAQITVALADDSLPVVRRMSCWAACHSDLPDMSDPSDAGLSKYLPNSRTAMTRLGGGESFRSEDDLAGELARGAFLEYWTVSLDGTGSTVARDGHILEAMNEYQQSAVTVSTGTENGMRTVTIQRPIAPGDGPRKQLAPGQRYSVSFAVHERYTEGRRHFVSFPFDISIGDDAVSLGPLLE